MRAPRDTDPDSSRPESGGLLWPILLVYAAATAAYLWITWVTNINTWAVWILLGLGTWFAWKHRGPSAVLGILLGFVLTGVVAVAATAGFAID